MEEEMTVDKSKMIDSQGRMITQSLFLEIGYNTEYALFTLSDNDKTYKGKLYPSLKRLYVQQRDPTEYSFANKWLLGWKHWLRIKDNQSIAPYLKDWKEELEVAIASDAVMNIMDLSLEDKGFQANKWLVDRGWDKLRPGRPTKAEKKERDRFKKRLDDEVAADTARMGKIVEL